MASYFAAAPDFGSDVSTFPAFDTSFAIVTGFQVLAQALARRLLTRKGLLPSHPDYGVDLRLYLNEAVDDSALTRMRAEVVHELQQDERVQAVDASVLFSPATGVLTATVQGTTAEGPFSFVLALSQVSINLYLGV
jgi:phage baseplate assembly protein W